MPKYVIPFNKEIYWESQESCPVCSTIDKFYDAILAQIDQKGLQDKIEFLDREYLNDGYLVLSDFEQNGYANNRRNDIERIKYYTTNSDSFMNLVNQYLNNEQIEFNDDPDIPVVIHSRWCKYCASRKPNIYDSNK